MINRKAQLGTTITWIPAFTIIFFIMIFFVGASGLLSKGKGINTIEEVKTFNILGKGEKNYNLNLENQLNLNIFLNLPVEKNKEIFKIKDLILLDLKDNEELIKSTFSSFVSSLSPNSCYGLTIGSSISVRDKLFKSIGQTKSLALVHSFLDENGAVMILDSNEIKFYSGGCNE